MELRWRGVQKMSTFTTTGPDIEILPGLERAPPVSTNLNSAVSAVLSHKARGNKLVSVGDFQNAADSYTDAILSLPNENYLLPTKLALHTNRALCYLSTKEWDLCRKDCDAALAIDETNVKAWYRRAQAWNKMNELKKAIQDLKTLLKLDPKNSRAKKLARSLIKEYNTQKEKKTSKTESKSSTKTTSLKKKSKKKSTFNGGGFDLYDDKLDSGASEEERLLERIRAAANKSDSSNNSSINKSNSPNQNSNNNDIEKTFAALLTPEGFKQRIFPGINLPEGFEAPSTLKELLNDKRYNDALVAMMPDVVAKADSVIHNVKKKAALEGDIMDSETEKQLRPQILLEAFARTVTKIISQTSATFVTQALRSSAPTASPTDEKADYDQLDENVVEACSGVTTTCCGVQNEFMGGKEWSQTIEEDLIRMDRSGRLQPADPDDVNPADGHDKTKDHMFAMVGSKECSEKYPALSELLENLEALPYELNKKGFLSTSGQPNVLTEPGSMSCAISKIKSTVGRRECIDGLTRGVQNGRDASCVYVVNGGGMSLCIRGTGDNVVKGGIKTDVKEVHLLEADALYAYHSLKTSNEIVASSNEDVNEEQEQEQQWGWLITMYCQSKS